MKGCEIMNLNGGYAMIKYNSTQEELAVAYKSKRPALFYDENQRAHWAVIEETATQSVDEETQEPITTYKYSYRLLDEDSGGGVTLADIVDSQGNKRFIEGNGTPTTISGITPTYCKWSLSGSHLMLVYAGNVSANTIIDAKVILVSFELPEFINNKIFPTFGTNSIDNKKFIFYKSNGLIQEVSLLVLKSNNGIEIKNSPTTQTISNTGGFRLQFDLLIDSE